MTTSKKMTLAERHDPTAIMPIDSADIKIGALGDYIGYNLRRAHTGEFQRFLNHFEDKDVRPQQFSVLVVIRENPGINQSQIGVTLGIKRANVVTILHDLEGQGLVERCPSSKDKRSYTLRLTDKGISTMAEYQAMHDTLEQEAIASLGEENVAEFLRLLKLLRANNSHMEQD